MGRPKLVQSLDSVFKCPEMLLLFLSGDTFIISRGPIKTIKNKDTTFWADVPVSNLKVELLQVKF